jgi:hypothetical protein
VLLGVSSSSESKVLYLPSPFIHAALFPYDYELVSKAGISGKRFSQAILVTFLLLDLPLDDILCINAPVWGHNFIESYHVAVLWAKQSLDMFVKYPI